MYVTGRATGSSLSRPGRQILRAARWLRVAADDLPCVCCRQPAMPAVTTLISFVIPPTPDSLETAAKAASLSD